MKKVTSLISVIIYIVAILSAVLPFPAFGETSVMDYSGRAIDAIGTAWIFTDARYYYKDGEKLEYTNEAQKPLVYGGKMYVRAEFAEQILMLDSSALKKDYINDCSLIDAKELSTAVGREYLFDERGFFVLSVGEFPYINSDNFTTLFEESDYIYRYVNFDNPKSEEILLDLKNNIGEKVHPRLFYTADDIEYIKEKTKTNTKWLGLYNKIIADADKYVSGSNPLNSNCNDNEKQSQASEFQYRMEILTTAHLLSGNEAYADKGMEYMDTMCAWETMGYTTSNLATGHWAIGMALGYDAFYDYMMQTDEGVEKAAYYRKRVQELPFRDTLDAYFGRVGREMSDGVNVTVKWTNICDNFQGVISGGMIALALSMADEDDMHNDSIMLLENLIRSMQLAVSLYIPDGGYYEGVGYSEYLLGNFTKGITALFNSCGTDYGLGNAKGFSNAGEFFLYMQTPENRFNFSDCSREASNTMIPAFFARYYGKIHTAKMINEENVFRNESYDILNYLHYCKADEKYGNIDVSAPQTDKYFFAAESGTFRNAFGTEKPTFVGFHGGTTNRKHDMLDTGEFVFEAGGIPWAIDLGGDSYSLPGYFQTSGYKLYRKHTQGENCVLINPLTDTDNYYGQALGKEATLVSYVSKDKGAFAVFDMTDVYKRDVTSYKRGYYFGDNRNTLTVQDEITLKDTSELYWFMHTFADIEIIDGNTAKLSCEGEELLLEVYSNQPFVLSKMSAVPLEGTPVIEGQNENEGISKVSVCFENVSRDVNIAVKLIYQSKYFDAEPLSFIPMDDWRIEDGICEVKPVLDDIYVDPFKNLSATVQLPFDVKEVYILAGNKDICRINVPSGSIQRVEKVDLSTLENGIYKAKMKVIYNDGHEEICESDFFVLDEYQIKVFYSNSMGADTVATDMPAKWSFYTSHGKAVQNEDYKTFTKGTGDRAIHTFRASNKSYALYDEVIVMECDVSFSSLSGTFMIECQNGSGVWFFNNYKTLFGNGMMYDGSSYLPDKWYRIKLEIFTKKNTCSFYVDNRVMIKNAYIADATSNYKYNLVFTPVEDDDAVSYKNFKVWTTTDEKNTSVNVSCFGDVVNAVFKVKDASLCETKDMKFIVCAYSDKRLEEIYIHKVVLDDDAVSVEQPVKISKTATRVKCFLLDGENVLVPIDKAVSYNIWV